VNADRGVLTARRYLLGQADEEECSGIEREYFADESAVERIAAVEEDLIEDYLGGRLPAGERSQFERHYLASPQHRARVETIRRLSALAWDDRTGGSMSGASHVRMRSLAYLALAAAVLIAVGLLWRAIPRGQPAPSIVSTQPAPSPAPRPAETRQVFAVSLSPIAVRSASDSQNVVIPAGTTAVALQLEGDNDPTKATNARAVIQTVAGDEVWRGAADPAASLPAGVIARFDVPASRLGIDDYIVVLFGTDAGGVERERNRYVLRLRAR
jgi:hypothetical protein